MTAGFVVKIAQQFRLGLMHVTLYVFPGSRPDWIPKVAFSVTVQLNDGIVMDVGATDTVPILKGQSVQLDCACVPLNMAKRIRNFLTTSMYGSRIMMPKS